MPKPDFLIVGAPRCGTTAMYEYLRRHPGIFMPEHKEPQFFGNDLSHLHAPLSEADYLGLFKGAKPGQRVGEASTWYLYSSTAAKEIKAFAPDARIIIMLRNPVDVMYSLHGELSFYGGEEIPDFEEALAAEPDRKRGQRRGQGRRAEALYYRDAVRFADQVERYLETFGPDAIKVILFHEFVADVAATYADTLRFLDVDASFRPDFEVINESKRARNQRLQALIVRPPGPLVRLIPMLRRFPLAHRVRSRILLANSQPVVREPLDPALRRRLTADLAPEIQRLAALIGRDLSAWSLEASPASASATA
ncbi:MAG TPA: sulfotransferase [Aeromicrobium sp.]|nr:sulfotransferase [Aeromicrobium sp.]